MTSITKNILQIAHRGNSYYHKDNSMDSISSAIKEGFSMIEIDIQICKTGEIIVYHDTYIESQMIENITYNDIMKIDDKILKLEEVFDISGVSNIQLYFDLKGSMNLVNALIHFFNSVTVSKIQFKNIIIASFNMIHIEKLYNYFPDISYGFITGNNFESIIYYHILRRKYIKFLSICWTMLNTRTCNILHGMGIKIYTYTCENDTILKQMLRYNIDGIVTNYKLSF